MQPIDCACVIHGNAYSWDYVDRLYNMLNRNISQGIILHVYTEAEREVPAHMVKHALIDWKISGSRRSWWYKMQLFNPEHFSGPLLYFDLDTVIVKNIDWITQLPLQYFWTIRDFKYLWRPTNYSINSSVMWWDTSKFTGIWDAFMRQNLSSVIGMYRGDQDFLNEAMLKNDLRFFDVNKIKSWRWEALNGGYNFGKKAYRTPTAGTQIDDNTSILIFHGNPKPNETTDLVIKQHWQ